MQKRRERIEQWRAARKAKEETPATPINIATASQKWTLEDDEDETDKAADAEATGQNGAEQDEVDPLDAYMQVVEMTIHQFLFTITF